MVLGGLQLEKIDNIDETDLDIRKLFSQQNRSGQRLLGRNVASGGHHYIGFDTLIVTGPIPNADALGAVLNCSIHIQILKMQLFVGNDHIDVVLASQAVVGYRQQAVGIGGKVDARNLGALVKHNVQEAWVLVRESVVVLAPDCRSNKEIK